MQRLRVKTFKRVSAYSPKSGHCHLSPLPPLCIRSTSTKQKIIGESVEGATTVIGIYASWFDYVVGSMAVHGPNKRL